MRLLVEGVGDRVALVPTSSGDVRIVVVDEDDVADVDAVERVPARALRFDPTVVPNDDGAAHDARARRASELDDALIASASMMARVKLSAHCAGAEPSEAEAAVLPRAPTPTPYDVDAYDAHSTPTPSKDWAERQARGETLATTDWIEVELLAEGGAGDSSSLARSPAPQSDFVRGSFSQVPFTPGGEGWDAAARESAAKRMELASRAGKAWLEEFEAGTYLSASTLPNTLHGMREMFDLDSGMEQMELELEKLTVMDDEELPMSYDDLFIDALRGAVRPEESSSEEDDTEDETEDETEEDGEAVDEVTLEGEAEVEALLNGTKSIIAARRRSKSRKKKGETWAVMERFDDVQEAYRREVPEPAHDFPFELDLFQKEAIVHLEKSENVFVAAHTSAGKTVVAEYAFALATKHCTRAIYTSPIKTISNQKFRDFGKMFDVGLLTGDVSIKPEAACLIMTTEILRSMLYRGADLIRDVEWVIFDEVHYVNDAERGVVWEEVIIMLPAHVGLILLSATVPNVFEFADWVGRTKRKKIFVTGTKKRPVPLEHCIYFGGDKEKDFYKVGEHEAFLPTGYKVASDAHKKKLLGNKTTTATPANAQAAKQTALAGRGGRGGAQQGRGGRVGGRGGTQNVTGGRGSSFGPNAGRDKNMWVELIRNLERRELLPMVVFAFSKKRCDTLVDSLTSMDLTSSSEKHEIHIFCERALSRLSVTDRKLPQVLRVRELLRRGLGVHHAGLLPIVKEIVEMLFCRGLLKVLYCTETFAMGVNAPARCVCFQSLRKHDGQDFRGLLSGEYTQMAGRAGRRGLDTVGTVILAAWENFPPELELRQLLSGQATKLQSQFRLTYGMILNLMRVEDLRVEDMLARSFAEFHAQRSVIDRRGDLAIDTAALRKVESLMQTEAQFSPDEWQKAVHWDDHAREIARSVEHVREAIMTSRGAQNALSPGRVLLVAPEGEGGESVDGLPRGGVAKHCVLLRVVTSATNGKSFVVLVSCPEGHASKGVAEAEDAARDNAPTATKSMNSKDKDDDDDFFGMSKKSAGGGKRGGTTSNKMPDGLPWFRQAGGIDYIVASVPETAILAITTSRLSVEADAILDGSGDVAATSRALLSMEKLSSETSFEALHPLKDLKIQDIVTVEACQHHADLVKSLPPRPVASAQKLREWSALLRAKHVLTSRVAELEFGLSDANLLQMPDFEARVAVLQRMGYLDENRTVTLKGRVACEIATGDELVGTEIIFAGVLTDIPSEEAVALLAALVFQEKNASPPNLEGSLKAACDRAKELAFAAGEIQMAHGLPIAPDEFVETTMRFGLSEVVYEWARGTPFADICQLTDVQEGSVVRTIVRLDEMCRDVRNAARIMGDSTLFAKMEEASAAIKRDIVFSASLYVAGAQ